MDYKKAVIFYLSGTGNALKGALSIASVSSGMGVETEVISVDRLKKPPSTYIHSSDLIGLCYPTHGFSLPWHMLRFILAMPVVKGKHFFLLNTRAGSMLFGMHLPGISGIAQWLPMLILWWKGYRIRGLLPLDMPSNWISIHPGFTTRMVNKITGRCMKLCERFAERIINGQAYYRPIAFIFIPLDIFLIPISLGYVLIGRFFMAKTFIADYKCTNCKVCIHNCPVEAIKVKFGRPYWTIHCESCMRCMNICPERAVQTAHGYVALVVFGFIYIPFFSVFSTYLMHYLHTDLSFIDGLLEMTIFTVVAMPFMFISYYLVSWLQKFKFFSAFFRLSSFTYYWKHYLASGIHVSDFIKKRHKNNN